MEGKNKAIFRFGCNMLGIELGQMRSIFKCIHDNLTMRDIVRLCSIGIPGSKMKTKKEAMDFVIKMGFDYMQYRKTSNFRKIEKASHQFYMCLVKQFGIDKAHEILANLINKMSLLR